MSRDPALLETLDQRVIDLITTHQRLQPGQVTLDSTFADLSIDSLDGMELVFEFEEAFNLTIPDEIARQMRSVRDVAEALRQALTAPPPDAGDAGAPPSTAS